MSPCVLRGRRPSFPTLPIVTLAAWLAPACVLGATPPAGADKTVTVEEDTPHRFTPSDFGFSDPLDTPPHAFQRILITTYPTAGQLLIEGYSLIEGEYVSMVPEPRMIWTPTAKSQPWTDIAVSASGDRMAAVWGDESPTGAPRGEIVLSADGGATWTPSVTGKTWNSLAMSPDGATLLAAPLGDRLSLSRDFGQTWNPVGPSADWQSVALSANGTHLLAAPQDGTLRISQDGGTTWSSTLFGSAWSEVAVSPDGSLMVAGGASALWISSDFGTTWSQPVGPIASQSVVISDDGTSVLIASFSRLYHSGNRGQTWELRGPSGDWGGLAASADLKRLVAVQGPFGTSLNVSSDGGHTWTRKERINRWKAVASSADGSVVAAAVNPGQIHTSRDSIPELTYVPAANAHGTPYANFTFRVGDSGPPGSDISTTQHTFTFNVLPVNDPPRVTSSLPDRTARERTALTFQISANAFTDPDAGTELTYEATLTGGAPLPAWLNFSPATRVFSGTPGSLDTGIFEIVVTVTESSSEQLSASDTFRLLVENVDDPPSGSSRSLSLVKDTPWTFSAADFGFTDPLDLPPGALGRVKLTTLPESGALTLDGLPVAAGDFARVAPSVPGAVWSQQGTARNWWAAASSTDGSQIAAVDSGGRIYVSADAGTTWTASESNRNWYSITSSADGRHLAAVVQTGQIFTSDDAGVTWVPRAIARGWRAITSSADGSRLAAIESPGQIHTSADFGVTWTPRETSRSWYSIASSADGQKLCAVVQNGTLFTSNDAGETWTPRETVRNWRAITSSADGQKLAAIEQGGQIHTSTDGGLTWTAREAVRDWYSIASSADGNRLIAAVRSGRLYHSMDAGATWRPRGPTAVWRAVTSSADGERLVALVPGERIYTSLVLPAQSLVFTPAPNGTGSPYASFSFQVEDDGAAAASLDPTPDTLTLNVASSTTPFQQWAQENGLPADPAAQAGENFLTFAFGLALDGSERSPMAAADGSILRRGAPALISNGPGAAPPFSVLYGRRIGSGLEFHVQFSSDLADWEPSPAPPSPAGQDAVVEAFFVPFPTQLANGRVPRFFRIRIVGP